MNKTAFWLVWVVGAGPMLLAIWLYFGQSGPVAGSQKGELLPPGATIESFNLRGSEGQVLVANGRWQLLLASPLPCQHRCAWWHEQLGQVHKALGKEQGRVEWGTLAAQPALTSLEEGIWIVDPNGNLVLRYNLAQQPQDLLKDLRRLLKVSRIG